MTDDTPAPVVGLVDALLVTNVLVSAIPVPLLSADPKRLSLLIAAGGNNVTAVFCLGPQDKGGFKFTLPQTGYTEFLWSKHGPLCGYALSVVNGFGAFDCCLYTLKEQ